MVIVRNELSGEGVYIEIGFNKAELALAAFPKSDFEYQVLGVMTKQEVMD